MTTSLSSSLPLMPYNHKTLVVLLEDRAKAANEVVEGEVNASLAE